MKYWLQTILKVETINLNNDYIGTAGYHAKDIAVIVLKDNVSVSIGVGPVCVDWSNKYYNIPYGAQGKVCLLNNLKKWNYDFLTVKY